MKKYIVFVILSTMSICINGQNVIDGHEYVDLGLPSGTLWATCNIGANSPDEYGDYFAWGESQGYYSGKENFSWENYKYCNGSAETITKYCIWGNYDHFDDKYELDIDDDTAHNLWGGAWEMPTGAQISELCDYCEYERKMIDGIDKALFTSKVNGNQLLIPLGGIANEGIEYAGESAALWTKTIIETKSDYAQVIAILPSFMYPQINTTADRCKGLNIRPVANRKILAEDITFLDDNIVINKEQTKQLKILYQPEFISNKHLIWSSSDENIVSVKNGIVKGLNYGNAIVNATTTDGTNISASCFVSVQNQFCDSPANGHEFVDLGLPSGTLWATCNVGACSPDDLGNYFSWGDTSGFDGGCDSFSWRDYPFINKYDRRSVKFNKYVTEKTYGYVDNKTTLELVDDAAYQNWGGGWHMPTKEQCKELLNTYYTTISEGTTNGVKGIVVKSKINNKFIFIPFNGNVSPENGLNHRGSIFYWTSNIIENDNDFAYSLDKELFGEVLTIHTRRQGEGVRPVLEKVQISNLLLPSLLQIYVGETRKITANILPNNATEKHLTWSLSDPEIARIDDEGYITALKDGSTFLTATTNDGSNLSATCEITVKSILASSISLSESSCSLNVGETLSLETTILPDDATIKEVLWSSSNEEIASVDHGVVLAKTPGHATIVAKTTDGSNLEAKCEIAVNYIPCSNIALDKKNISLHVNETYELKATLLPENVTNKSIEWSSLNENVAVVESGKVTAIAEGTTNIVVKTTDGTNLSATCEVKVSRHHQEIIWNQNLNSVIVGGELVPLTAYTSTGLPLVYASNNEDVVTIFDFGNAIYLNAFAVGTADITASQAGNDYYAPVSMTKTVNVTVDPNGIDGVGVGRIYTIYTLNGIKVGCFNEEEYRRLQLPKGAYVVNGKIILK